MSGHDWRPTGEDKWRCPVCGARKRISRAPVGVRVGVLFTEYLAPRAGAWSKHPVPCRVVAASQLEQHSGAPS